MVIVDKVLLGKVNVKPIVGHVNRRTNTIEDV